MRAALAGLQSPEAQHLLSELARCPAIRLLASMDHVNAPLLWDRRTAARFNWLYFDVTTYAPYHAEAQEMPSLLIGRRCAPGARSASRAARCSCQVSPLRAALPKGDASGLPAAPETAGEDPVRALLRACVTAPRRSPEWRGREAVRSSSTAAVLLAPCGSASCKAHVC